MNGLKKKLTERKTKKKIFVKIQKKESLQINNRKLEKENYNNNKR